MATAVDDRDKARMASRHSLALAHLANTHTENSMAAQVVLELVVRQPVEQRRREPTVRNFQVLIILAHEYGDGAQLRTAPAAQAQLHYEGGIWGTLAARASFASAAFS
ncbi:hypothetical protein GCM10022197_26290 [Microlunatus spumicola]|uniref:Uncharacterized protein n=1 Tax=Microlunatus spumicola TaxID=81499 RepID=A0ABP6XMH0_9ACTN